MPRSSASGGSPPFASRQRSRSAAFSLVVFSRTSSRTVLNRNDSTSRRTGREQRACDLGPAGMDQLVLDQLEVREQASADA